MIALMIADTHGNLSSQELDDVLGGRTPDVVVLLGDHSAEDIQIIHNAPLTRGAKKIGVVGNHDAKNLLVDNGIEDIHLKTVEINGVVIGGFGGSHKYKDDSDYYMLHTHEQSQTLLANMPPVDILICHDMPYCDYQPSEEMQEKLRYKLQTKGIKGALLRLFGKEKIDISRYLVDDAHCGLKGIKDYINEKHPEKLFYGHYHVRTSYGVGRILPEDKTSRITKVRCIYGLELVEI